MSVGLMPEGPPASRFAYVTLATNADYALGALALVNSIKATGTGADCVVLHTAVPEAGLEPLRQVGARLIGVDLLDTSTEFNATHAREALHARAAFTKGVKPPFHTPLDNFAKLRLWQLVEYEAVVFIDADAVMLRNCDKLFAYPEFCAAPNVYESLTDFHRLNSGVFTAQPSAETFQLMLDRLDRPGMFWRRTDQTFLESFFPDWHGLPVFYNMLQYVWFNMPDLWSWEEIHILHYQYEKPWQDHEKAGRLRPLIDIWRGFAGQGPRLDIASLPAPA
ncbi:MAG TPA: glycosyltransferase family 8 protein [Paracoccus sp. (in: a-proteobacteria)]|uniref:glycosyltransferase family 8 protein n=1 Tax=uncultured Paracoccus sp. TaxID=189685 RepID=UPI002625E909|nr:glycosyltransferase family 8 protein [uncultured Paracoccus sp.]HMQ39903.1 glycosyltransferase family 8 protein [Paracoccus sp. (in: a-proteobacteria)]HMR35586.1 glycosyltransferase family 8 protein [Paracoccus sp. (in: a-proteobacteria)]